MGPDPLASTGIPPFEGPPPPPPPTDFNLTFPTNGTNFTVGTNETFLPWGPIPTDAGRSLQADIVACAVITWLIALGFVVVRFYTRGRLNNVLGASDWCIIPALVFAAGVMASSLERRSCRTVSDIEIVITDSKSRNGSRGWETRLGGGLDADVGAGKGGLVWDSVLQFESHILKDFDTFAVSTHLYLQLGEAGDSDCACSRGAYWDLACCFGLHGLYPA